MLPTIATGNVASAIGGAYEVANSCRFNRPDSPRLVIANPTEGVREKGTFSTWFKKASGGTAQYLFSTWNNATSGYSSGVIYFPSADDRLNVSNYVASGASGHSTVITERRFRDPSAWYHVVVAWDTTDGTAADRYKIYVNGTRETVFNGTPAYPTADQELFFQIGGTANPQHIGYQSTGSDTHYFDGYLAETVHIDGYALAADSFGAFDEDSPTIWKPKDVSGLTFGDEGFYLDYEDSGDLGDDESGNGNDFAETNLAATDQATDTPTNNFATLNSLVTESGSTFSEGNCKVVTSSSLGGGNFSTIAASAGKWYAEFKLTAHSAASAVEATINVSDTSHVAKFNDGDYTTFLSRYAVGNWGILNYLGRSYVTSSGSQSTTDTQHDGWALNDIIGVALDCDNHKVYFSKNGGWQDAVDSWGGSSPDSYLTIQSDFGEGSYVFNVGDSSTSSTCTWECNFGGSSAFTVSSGNADGNGYGNFEYAVPSGFLALCTKNLGSDGG